MFFILFGTLFFFNNIHAQNMWKKNLGIWINIELNKRIKLNQPFDSLSKIIPRFLWLKNLKELEIESRFEQKRKYLIKNINDERILIKNARVVFKRDTLVMIDKYYNVVKFIKYKQRIKIIHKPNPHSYIATLREYLQYCSVIKL